MTLKNKFIKFALPYLLSYFLQTLYGMADLYIIGQFGQAKDITSVALGSQVMHMVTVMLVGLAMGTTVMIAQSVGAKKEKDTSYYIGNSITIFLVVAIVLTIGLVLSLQGIVSILSTPQEAITGTSQYLLVCFLGVPCIIAYNLLASIFRGMGDSKTPMYFIAIACGVNILLDYVFMGIYHSGPIGAAFGTILAQASSVLFALVAIIKKKMVKIQKEDLKLQNNYVKNIFHVGLPVCIQDGLIQVGFLIITVIANQRGVIDSAAVGIVEKIISFLFLVPSTLLSTVSSLGAQCVGADRQEDCDTVLHYAIKIAIGFGLILAVLVQFIAKDVLQLFTSDTQVVLSGAQYLKGYIFDCLFAGLHFSFSGYFCAHNKSIYSFIHNILAIVCVRVPGVYLASKLFPTTLLPMGLATALGSLLSACICFLFYKKIKKTL